MSRFAVIASAVSAVALLGVAPAAADYVIEEDPAMPSVVYIRFDPETMPKVIMAPSADSLGLSVINGGDFQDQADVDADNPDLPEGTSQDQAADSNDDDDEDFEDDTASISPLEDRINQRVEELTANQPDVEDLLIDREIEDRLLEETDRLLN